MTTLPTPHGNSRPSTDCGGKVGPWEVRPCVDGDGTVVSLDICHPAEPSATGVAVVASVFEGMDIARLIAAAPDLLEALQGLVEGFPLGVTTNEYELIQGGCDPTEARKIAKAHAAISKALGESTK